MIGIEFLIGLGIFIWFVIFPIIGLTLLSKIRGDMSLLKDALQKLQPQKEKTKPWLAHSAQISFPELAPSSPSPPLVPETQAIPSHLSLGAGSVQSHPVGGLEGDNLEGDNKEDPKAEALQTLLDQPIATADQSFAATGTKTPVPPPIQKPKDAPKPEPSGFEKAAKETLQKIGNWILFGQEKLSKGESFEFAVASQWLLRIGILVLVLGMGFFVKYSIEQDLISKEVRVLLTASVGMALLVGGTQLLGRKYQIIGQGLMGGGLITLYFSVYAAHAFYHMISPTYAFALMALVTVLAGSIAVGLSSILVAVLGVLGGYGTPLMIQSENPSLPILHTYMLILAVGILGVCASRKWPLVHFLAFLCHYILFSSSILKTGPACYPDAIPFAASYFLLFSTMPFLYSLRTKNASSLLDLLGLYANAAVSFLLGYEMLANLPNSDYSIWVKENGPASLSLALAFFYAIHAVTYLRLKISDRPMLVSFLGLASVFLALTMPLYLSNTWLTSSWAIQAVVMVWISQKLGSRFLRQLAYLLMFVVLGRYVFVDLGNRANLLVVTDTALSVYLGQLLIRLIQYGIPIAGLFGAGWLLSKDEVDQNNIIDTANDVKNYINRTIIVRILAVGGGLLLFAFLFLELNQTLGFLWSPLRLPGLTWLMVLFGFLVLCLGEFWVGRLAMVIGISIMAGILGIKLLFWDLDLGHGWGRVWTPRDGVLRIFDFAAVVGLFGFGGWFLTGLGFARAWPAFGTAAVFLTLVLATTETDNLFHYLAMDGMSQGAISIVWTLFALGMILWGIRVRERLVRYGGLGLFAVVAIKVFGNDLAELDAFYRIIAFLILGVLLLIGSFVYLKYQNSIHDKEGSQS